MFEKILYRKAMLIFAVLFLLACYSSHLEYKRSLDPLFKVKFDSKPELNYSEAAGIASYLDSVLDRLHKEDREVSKEEVIKLVMEIAPNFQYEGAVDKAVMPSSFDFMFYSDGDRHNHILGQSNCEAFVINLRYINPYSTLYNDPDWIQTVIHEMVHVQQGALCQTAERENIENTAELVTWEIMAAQVNRGNTQFLYPLLDSIKGRMLSVAWLLARKEGKMDDFEELRYDLDPTPYSLARWEKSKRYWVSDPTTLRFIQEAYGKKPLEKIIEALLTDQKVEGLALPETLDPQWRRTERVFPVDDLYYLFLHLEELVGGV